MKTEQQQPVQAVNGSGETKATELVMVGNGPAGIVDSALAMLDKLEGATPGMNIAPEYREFEKEGESVRGVFMGWKVLEKQTEEGTKEILSAVWMEADGKTYLNAGTSLVGSLKSLSPGTPIEIKYTGKKKANQGHVKLYEVRPLNIGISENQNEKS